jgi:hypothetical protein
MRNWREVCLAESLTDVNALGVYSHLQMSMTRTNWKYIIHPVDRLVGVALTLDEYDDQRTIRSKLMQAAPIPDTRDLIWSETKLDPSMRPFAIDSDIDPTLGVDAVIVKYAFFHKGSWVYLHRFIVLNRFISPRELFDMLKKMIPDFSEEESELKSIVQQPPSS